MSFLKEKPRIIPMVMRGCCCSIIPYQEIIGNYSTMEQLGKEIEIIPYQEIIGNYSGADIHRSDCVIIPYQEIIGNYSLIPQSMKMCELYHTKK